MRRRTGIAIAMKVQGGSAGEYGSSALRATTGDPSGATQVLPPASMPSLEARPIVRPPPPPPRQPTFEP